MSAEGEGQTHILFYPSRGPDRRLSLQRLRTAKVGLLLHSQPLLLEDRVDELWLAGTRWCSAVRRLDQEETESRRRKNQYDTLPLTGKGDKLSRDTVNNEI